MQNNGQGTIYNTPKMTGVSSASIFKLLNKPATESENKRKKSFFNNKKINFFSKTDTAEHKSYKKIGIIAPFFTQASFMERLRGIADVLGVQNYELVIYSVTTANDLEDYISSLVDLNRVDALIILSLNLKNESLELLRAARFPVCFVENEVDGFDCVAVQNLQGGHKAAMHLFNAGVKRPGFVGEKSALSYSIAATDDRLRGFKFFFANQGILIPDNHIWVSEFGEKAIDDGINQFLSQELLPDGVFCSSDLIAARFIHIAHERGLYIPDDIKVIGFDDIDIASYMELSSVSQSLDESGYLAADLVLKRLKDPRKKPSTKFAAVKVIERGSTSRKF